jgi:hypothetical protein
LLECFDNAQGLLLGNSRCRISSIMTLNDSPT